MRIFLPILIFVIFVSFVVFSPNITLANHRQSVLGDSTASSELVFPPLSSGPGFFLPNSPLYFLDKWFQTVRLAFAFSPEKRAVIRSQIAGERLAELRVMLAQNDKIGINTALSELTREAGGTANSLSQAAAQGRDVKDLAAQLNETVKTQRKVLGILASQAQGTLKLQLKATREALHEAKIEIEDKLPEGDLENELEEDIHDAVDETEDTSRGLEHAIDVLSKLASVAAERNQEKRVEALQHAIEVKSDALHKQQERLLNEQENAARHAHDSLKDAQKALNQLSKSAKESREIKAQSDSSGSGSSDSGGSGSGSSGDSGSGSSGSPSTGSGSSGSGSSGSGDSGSGSGHSGHD